jgi:SAM-dependent methyltransferase
MLMRLVMRLVWFLRRRIVGETLWRMTDHPDAVPFDAIRFNIKNFGYQLGRELAGRIATRDVSSEPRRHNLACKPTTQSDMESPWFAYWCQQLRIAPLCHRKLWEYAYLLQALFEHDKLNAGATAIGFGCGEEPIASYLASRGIRATVTDLDPATARAKGWIDTGQHTSTIEQAFKPEILSRAEFDRMVSLEYVDMNAIPRALDGRFDLCWSICALEHLGSIEHGLRFVSAAMRTLKPGGLAIHTTEFNFLSEAETLDHPSLCLYLRKHFTELKERLEREGHIVAPLDFDTGNGVLDRFVDVPPYAPPQLPERIWGTWGRDVGALKLLVSRYPSTCFGLIIQKGP